jgi:hypothetical protein
MDLDVVAFPALVIADDGWVEQVGRKEDLSVWSRSAIAKYSKRLVLFYDSADRAWRVDNVTPVSSSKISSRLSAIFSRRRVRVQITVRQTEGAPREAVQAILCDAIDADDDILTQFTEADDLKDAIQKTDSFAALLRVLKEKRAI